MGRNNPKISQNPSTKWFEWQGSKGQLYYYDKAEKENFFVDFPFTFLLIEQMSTVGGWYDRSESGIYSNEVKNISQEPLTVQSFKGGEITNGLYRNIKDSVKSAGGYYVASLYIGFKTPEGLQLGNIKLKGAALSEWMEFSRRSGKELWEKSVTIIGYDEGQKGSIEYRIPSFELKMCSEKTNKEALELDNTLQEYLKNRPTNQLETSGDEHIDQYVPHLAERVYSEPVGYQDDLPPEMQETIESDDLPF